MKISQRIQLIIVPLMILLFSASGVTLNYLSKNRVRESIRIQEGVYIDKLIQIVDMVEAKTGSGLSSDDIFELRTYFLSPAYYSTDYPAIISTNGVYLLHTTLQGQRLPSAATAQIRKSKSTDGYIYYDDYSGNKPEKRLLCYKFYKPYNAYIAISVSMNEALAPMKSNRMAIIVFIILASLLTAFAIPLLLKPIIRIINLVNIKLRQLAKGDIPNPIKITSKDELGEMVTSLNQLMEGLKSTTSFAHQIGQNQLEHTFQPLSSKDELGNALLDIQSNLKHALEEEQRRKEEDYIRGWVNEGLAKFGDILRQNNNNLTLLADSIIQNLVNYLEANQGGIFIYNDSENDKHLEMLSAFAYNRKKFISKTIPLGEGLVGACALEKKTIYLKEIPADYIAITSGLGEATPTALLIVPLKLEDEIFGVVEVASFREFKPYEIEFVEKIGESIASTLFAVKNSIRTNMLLEQSQQQREEMAAQEEEMRQNMEEMQATQEEMLRKNIELELITNTINQSLLSLTLSEEGYIADSNQNFVETLGYSKTELEGKMLADIVNPEQRTDFQISWKKVRAGQTITETIHVLNRNGNSHYLMVTVSPELDPAGAITKVLLIGQDITEMKQLEIKAQRQAEEIEQNLKQLEKEQELSAQRQKDMSTLLEALDQNCLVSIIEPDGLITYINNKNVEVLGDKKEDIEGKFLHDIDYSAKHRPAEYKKFWDNILNGKKQQREFSLTVKEEVKWVLENFTPVMDESGKLYKIINIGFDITENKNKEAELTKIIEQMKNKPKNL
ncbi:MAG: PAS domain-containing protein [Bacteroidales bacterium]|nr:PAS domain-containing protein [Bacteroidales bacterium]